ncbi:hypothetical protein A4A49_34544 [Nicotiana attenuata]|uniref:Uncharacterized protein n=1 Tax=Nicotiana attenuata TaxID=49451 RepID=A0A1J6KSC5_NICAT|nr:hypothetical protein A4A49_34544 [Nicotiana attenuata]
MGPGVDCVHAKACLAVCWVPSRPGLGLDTTGAIEIAEKPAVLKATGVHDKGQDVEGVIALDSAAPKGVKAVIADGVQGFIEIWANQANTVALEMVQKPVVIELIAVHDEGQGLEDVDALNSIAVIGLDRGNNAKNHVAVAVEKVELKQLL